MQTPRAIIARMLPQPLVAAGTVILAVLALLSYRKGMPIGKAAAILREGRAQQWDATVVDAFLRTIADESEQPVEPVLQRTPEAAPVAGGPPLVA